MNIQYVLSRVILLMVLNISVAFADVTAPITDSQIAKDVSMQIAADNALQGLNIIVTCQNGMVTLDGIVYSQGQVNEAISDAQSVTGVQNVVSTMVIDNTGS